MQRKDDAIRLKDYRPSAYLIDKTELRFELDEKDTVVKSTLHIRKNPEVKDDSKNLVLDGENIQPDKVILNGKTLPPERYTVTESTLTIHDVPKAIKLQIQNHLNPKENDTLNGLYVTNGVLCTLCEAESFRRLTYFIDRPDVLSSYKTTLVADKKKYPFLLSNGTLTSKGNLKNGKHWATWNDPIPKPSYLFVMVAGQFDVAEDTYTTKSGRDIKIQVYVEKGKADQCGLAIDVLKKAMRWDEETYGREYDLNTYKIVTVDDFDASADENTGINIFKTDCLLGTPANSEERDLTWIQSTVPHEFFHHWSGNRVTIRDWFQVSLKEGLTTFREQGFNEENYTRAKRLDSVKSMEERQFQSDSYPVQPASFDKFEDFQQDGTSSIYDKGAEIFRMLETYLGKSVFRQGMKTYFDRFKGKAATFENCIETLEEVSKKELSQFLLWFRQPGTPELKVTGEYNSKAKTYTIKVDQSVVTASATAAEELGVTSQALSDTKPLPIPIRLALFDKKGKAIPLCMTGTKTTNERVLLLTENKGEFKFKNVRSKPVLSILRGFTAPVILSQTQTQDDLEVLLRHDDDLYTKFKAGKKYITQILLEMISNYANNQVCETPARLIESMKILLKANIDPLVLSKLLALPSEMSICQSLTEVDLDAIHAGRETLINDLAVNLKEEFASQLQRSATHDETDLKDDPGLRKSLGKRQLQNACRFYLVRSDQENMQKELLKRFNETLNINFSDNLAALQLLTDQGGEVATSALATFYDKWKENPEKLLRWIEVQAASNSKDYFERLNALLEHKSFNITNDQQAASLFYGFFSNLNKCFGNEEKSYQFIGNLYQRLLKAGSVLANELIVIIAAWTKCLDETRLIYLAKHVQPLLKKEMMVELTGQENNEAEEAVVDLEQTDEENENQQEEEAEEENAQEQEREQDTEQEIEEENEIELNDLNSKTPSAKDAILEGKTNRQIHLLLQKQGLFQNSPELLKKSSKQSCENDRESYREFASQLLRK